MLWNDEEPLQDTVERQRNTGKWIIIWSLFLLALYEIFFLPIVFGGYSFEVAVDRAVVSNILALIFLSPSLLAALWQYRAKPGPAAVILCWFAYLWLLFQLFFGLQALLFMSLI